MCLANLFGWLFSNEDPEVCCALAKFIHEIYQMRSSHVIIFQLPKTCVCNCKYVPCSLYIYLYVFHKQALSFFKIRILYI
jgi:hypothetical protein